MRDQSLSLARRKISFEAPVAEPLAARMTLLSRNSLTCPRGTCSYPLHRLPSTGRFARQRICAAVGVRRAAREGARQEKAEVPVSVRVSARLPPPRFRRACSFSTSYQSRGISLEHRRTDWSGL